MTNQQRQIVATGTAEFLPYDLDGPLQPDISWLPVSYQADSGNGSYLMRMQPGAVTIEHVHEGVEDYMVLEGELIESDGTVLKAGDFVSYAPGSRHNSRTETGCLIVVCEWGKTP